MNVVIANARLVNEGRVVEGDLRVRDQRIDAVGGELTGAGDPVVDAAGAYLIPGMIDDQVHFREPGFEHKGDLGSESRAAVAGGITSVMEMPNTIPNTTTHEVLEAKYALASKKCVANHAFYFGATNDNAEAIRSLDPRAACGVKVFMGASTGNMLVDNPDTLEAIFAGSPVLIATHCEDTPIILGNEAEWAERYGDRQTAAMHPDIRSREACLKSSTLAVELARKHDARLHVLHLTTADELVHFSAGPLAGKRITVEACVHHLFFSADDYAARGNLIKCNPAIKLASDRDALLDAVRRDVIDVIATDHAPHTLDEKSRPYPRAPAGLPLVQHALLTLFDHVAAGRLDVETVVKKTSHAPAEMFDVAERGYLREGYFADLALVDPDGGTDGGANLLSRCGWSPFAGHTFAARILGTWVNGRRVWDGEQVDGSQPGQRLRFER